MKQAIQQSCVGPSNKVALDLLKVSSEKKQKKAIDAKDKSESLCGFIFV